MDTQRLIEEYKKIMFVEDEEATRVDSLSIADLSYEIHEETEYPFDELIEFGNTNQDVFNDIKSFTKYLKDVLSGTLNEAERQVKIKLVIWDLDDTFWSGTLAEGDSVKVTELGEKLKDLVSAGVMNSICSKNKFEDAKAKLEELGLWDYFVFPSISWDGKGPRVKQLIQDMQLREPNVIFIDDNAGNLEEVRFFCPEIGEVLLPGSALPVVERAIAEGKDDSSHSRLNQYKLLERKHISKTNFKTNKEFLQSSNIRATVIENPKDHFDRIFEMVDRTNQLNFTKVRSTPEELRSQLEENDNLLIQVKDNFGDYGIVGFASIDSGKVTHFLFSCRVLGMGIESKIWKYLGEPEIDFAEPLAYELDVSNDVGAWVTIEDLR